MRIRRAGAELFNFSPTEDSELRVTIGPVSRVGVVQSLLVYTDPSRLPDGGNSPPTTGHMWVIWGTNWANRRGTRKVRVTHSRETGLPAVTRDGRGRRIHDLRHTAAPFWLANGIDPKAVQA